VVVVRCRIIVDIVVAFGFKEDTTNGPLSVFTELSGNYFTQEGVSILNVSRSIDTFRSPAEKQDQCNHECLSTDDRIPLSQLVTGLGRSVYATIQQAVVGYGRAAVS
jgi:hypothetical protein